jgi:hypothetical protein
MAPTMLDSLAKARTAADLRRSMAESIAEKMQEESIARERAAIAHREFVHNFLHDSLSRREIADLRTRVIAAAARGAFEALVMRFSSDLCEDGGRAINNGESGWCETLPGKARHAYRLWYRIGRPRGYGLRGLILDYPGGMPGDVGLFLDWSPPAKT